MKTCPDCGHAMKDTHERCVKCGALEADSPAEGAVTESTALASPPQEGATKKRLKVLKAFVPTRDEVRDLLPHPAGWVLGIGLPAVLILMIIHGLALPGKSETRQEKLKDAETQMTAEKSRFQRCLAKAREKADLECAGITGTGAGLRRMTCTAARLSADYTRCTASHTGRLGACLGRCGQEARTCSSSCAILGGADQDWTDTAKCLLPCWAEHLSGCGATCFRTGGEPPAPPQGKPSSAGVL